MNSDWFGAFIAVTALALAPPSQAQTRTGQKADQSDSGPTIAYRIRDARDEERGATNVMSIKDAERLRTLEGITLQWIGWDRRGKVSMTMDEDGVMRLSGSQLDQSGAGVRLSGRIAEVGKDYFLLDGRIEIADAPSVGRSCDLEKVSRFEVTQRRSYYRLREFEWCDGLTDYIDLYFDPRLR